MTIEEYNSTVWTYYLQLENDFYKTLNYVEFSTNNYSTFSKEYAKQFLSICSEIDVVCKLLCAEINSSAPAKNICDYASVISAYNDFSNATVKFLYNNTTHSPWAGWSSTSSPTWWDEHNLVKHHRTSDSNFEKANLQNTFMALAALYILNRYYCNFVYSTKRMKEPSNKSSLFSMVGWPSSISLGGGFVQTLEANGSLSVHYDG